MTAEWSPADHPESIAMTQAYWWMLAAGVCRQRMLDGDDRRLGFSTVPVDGMLFLFCLYQVRTAAHLMRPLAVGEFRTRLDDRCKAFDRVVPREVRNSVVHLEAWSRGLGDKQAVQPPRHRDEETKRAVARRDWGLQLEHADGKATAILLGSVRIGIEEAYRAARDLQDAINAAAWALDPPDGNHQTLSATQPLG